MRRGLSPSPFCGGGWRAEQAGRGDAVSREVARFMKGATWNSVALPLSHPAQAVVGHPPRAPPPPPGGGAPPAAHT